MPSPHALDQIARGLADGMSRREALRKGGAAFLAAMTITPTEAWARATHHCPHHRVSCGGRCCHSGEICIHPKRTRGHGKHGPAPKPHCGCPAGSTKCGGRCVHTRTDSANCGHCGHRCAPGETCAGGRCRCAQGKTSCGGRCVELTSDPKNCGKCGYECGRGVCADGTCVSKCPQGQYECSGGCVRVAVDPNNCGGCGHVCDAGQVCAGGVCVVQCPSGTTDCNGACVNLSVAPNNCGACGQVCAAGTVCSSGACVATCPPNTTACGGSCVDPGSDPANCGGCGRYCPPGHLCVNGGCGGCPPNTVACGSSCCEGTGCCSGGCATAHDNGVGGRYYDCGRVGSPGDATTYTQAMAKEAAASYSPNPLSSTTCPGGEVVAAAGTDGTTWVTWGYSGSLSGRVNVAQNGPVCPTPASGTWN